VVANESHRFLVAEQLRQVGAPVPRILLEPVGRNTAPAIAVAALQALADGGDPLLLVLPSDHVVADVERSARRCAKPARRRTRARWSPSASCRRHRKPASVTSRPMARATACAR
jgi:mannose-1-phosphate guanylyltransferase